jgi:hypothetical protein
MRIVLEEITVVNVIAVIMMAFILRCRRKNRESIHTEDKIYDAMAAICLIGALAEMASYWLDGRLIVGGIFLNYLANSISFGGTVILGFLWCFYTDLRIYKNYERSMKHAKVLIIPLLIETVALIYNSFGTGLMFTISETNVYQRSAGNFIAYVCVLFYFAESMALVRKSKNRGFNVTYFPIFYFIGPCLLGAAVQFFVYGITASWISVAIAITFVQMQAYSENIYIDELSGLFNRRYLNGILSKKVFLSKRSVHGIMLDVNDFKKINDTLGHNVGDRAIRTIGEILFRSIPEEGRAIRYAGDEFIILLIGADSEKVF